MKTITRQAAQGDVLFRRVGELPPDVGAEQARRADGALVLAHSETGHHHVTHAERVRLYGGESRLIAYLVVGDAYADVVHERSFDTHGTLSLAPGVWEVRRQREHSPEGWRQVAD